MFEIELDRKKDGRLLPGVTINNNSQVPASELTRKNMFKKMNFSMYDPNTVNIRQKGGI